MTEHVGAAAAPHLSGAGTWDQEYVDKRVIPSTTRTLPSKALRSLMGLVSFSEPPMILDIGCGNGRNAVWLAPTAERVVGVDFSTAAVRMTRQHASGRHLSSKISLIQADLCQGLPLKREAFDLAIDSYVSCHFAPDWVRKDFQHEVARVLRSGSCLMSSQFATDDGYYRHLAEKHGWDGQSVLDPNNGIRKFVYAEDELFDLFAECFRLVTFLKICFEDIVLGRPFLRKIWALLYQRL